MLQLGCPRKCVFDFRRNTEFFEKHTEFRGIPRNSAVFYAVKLPGISRNSAEFRMYLHTEFRRKLNDLDSRFQIPKNTVGSKYPVPLEIEHNVRCRTKCKLSPLYICGVGKKIVAIK
jgi:hypothetical protein